MPFDVFDDDHQVVDKSAHRGGHPTERENVEIVPRDPDPDDGHEEHHGNNQNQKKGKPFFPQEQKHDEGRV